MYKHTVVIPSLMRGISFDAEFDWGDNAPLKDMTSDDAKTRFLLTERALTDEEQEALRTFRGVTSATCNVEWNKTGLLWWRD